MQGSRTVEDVEALPFTRFGSLAGHVALLEAGIQFDPITVDFETKRTQAGDDYRRLNPKGYVPALLLGDGRLLTENVAILRWIADEAPHLAPGGELGRYRLLETLSFIAIEVHKGFPFLAIPDEAKPVVLRHLDKRLGVLVDHWQGPHLFGRISASRTLIFSRCCGACRRPGWGCPNR